MRCTRAALLTCVLLAIIPGASLAQTSKLPTGTRVTVSPLSHAELNALQNELTANRDEKLNGMRREFAAFQRAKSLAPEWINQCNRESAAKVALYAGNASWEKVASRHAPMAISVAMDIEQWFAFVKSAFGQPHIIAEIMGRNFKCRAEITAAYGAHYNRLSTLGNELSFLETEISAVKTRIASLPAPRDTQNDNGTRLSSLVNPKTRICYGNNIDIGDNIGSCGGNEREEGYYSCAASNSSARVIRSRNKWSNYTLLMRLQDKYNQDETATCGRSYSGDWINAKKLLKMIE